MTDAATKTWVETSKSALISNVREIRHALKPNVKFMAVVKSNAYGHGIAQTVRAVGDEVDWFGVDSLGEAEEVRRGGAGEVRKILILGYTPEGAHKRLVRQGFRQVAYDRDTVKSLAAAASVKKPALIHLKVETGTSRQGLERAALPSFLRWLKRVPRVRLEGMYTHYANIEDTNDPSYAMKQLRRFSEATEMARSLGLAPSVLHTACSAAVMLHPETQFDLVRVGISLYGHWSSEVTRENVKLKGGAVKLSPALVWKTRLAQVKSIAAGTPVSYGLTEKVSRDSRVAVLPVGYWDGFDRGLSSVGYVLVRGRRAKVLGRVCMNMCVIDVTDIHGVKAGDEAVLLGRQGKEEITAEEMAAKLGTINYEVMTRINPLIPRVLVK
jgi:alanine racemase